MCNAYCQEGNHAIVDYAVDPDLVMNQYVGCIMVLDAMGEAIANYEGHGFQRGDIVKILSAELAPESPVPQIALDIGHPHPMLIKLKRIPKESYV